MKVSKNIKRKGLKALVTGGGGFIGGALIKELKERGYKITCLDRSDRNLPKGTPFIQGDILDEKVVSRAMRGKDVVFHLAGVLGTEELQYACIEAVQANVIGALNVFNTAVKHKVKVILISKPNPWLNTYSITKEMADKFCRMYQRDFGMKALTVRWFSVYGPAQKHYGVRKAVPTFVVAALQNKPLEIYGNGRQHADFIYVTDTVKATIDLSESKKAYGKTFEIGSGVGTSPVKLAKEIIKISNSNSKIKYIPMRKGEDPNTRVVADLSEIKKVIDYKPEVSFQEGMEETIAYYRDLLASAH